MARLLKCYGVCGNKYPKEELTQYKGKNYCKDCLKVKRERDEDYKNLTDYIKKIFNNNEVNPFIRKQIKDYEEGGFTLKGIRSTLWYIVNILKIRLDERYGIAIVKYKYYEAKKYSQDKNKQREQVSNKQEEKEEVKYVRIKNFRNNSIKKKFSLEDIELNEEDFKEE